MCGIFGIISKTKILKNDINKLAFHARQRGRDSSGLVYHVNENYEISRGDYDIKTLLAKRGNSKADFVMGHSRLITNGLGDNQPVVRDGMILIHNGIIVNNEQIWDQISFKRKFQID